ncbi:hypothetical protein GN956_G11176 [Arapaima gigas]
MGARGRPAGAGAETPLLNPGCFTVRSKSRRPGCRAAGTVERVPGAAGRCIAKIGGAEPASSTRGYCTRDSQSVGAEKPCWTRSRTVTNRQATEGTSLSCGVSMERCHQ